MARPAEAGTPRAIEVRVRMTPAERQLMRAVAQTLQRNPSDAARYLFRAEAERLGVIPPRPTPRVELEQPDADG